MVSILTIMIAATGIMVVAAVAIMAAAKMVAGKMVAVAVALPVWIQKGSAV